MKEVVDNFFTYDLFGHMTMMNVKKEIDFDTADIAEEDLSKHHESESENGRDNFKLPAFTKYLRLTLVLM